MSLSYTRAREVVLAKFRAIGVDTSRIGLHSLRLGGALAALHSGVPDHVIKNHGRWKSDSAKELYIAAKISDGGFLLIRA